MKENSDTAKIYFVWYKSALVRIDPRNIIYLHAKSNYCEIHLKGKSITIPSTLGQVSGKLVDEEYLVRADRSNVVNMLHVTNIIGKVVFMSDSSSIKLSDSGVKTIMNKVEILK